ncbi:hypothetical protein M2146_001041 [Lachnospiraceae bacterium PF1-22]
MTNIKLRYVLFHIAQKAHPEGIPKFFIEVDTLESDVSHATYNGPLKVISINNMSRNCTYIMISVIHELAHHVENCKHDNMTHNKAFYSEFRSLLRAAITLGYVDYSEARKMRDSDTIHEMEEYFGPLCVEYNKERDVNRDYRTINVYGGYQIKDFLKDQDFLYSALEEQWEKDCSKDEAERLKNQILEIEPKTLIKIRPINEIKFEPIYTITVSGKTYPIKDILSENGFFYVNKTWKRKIKKEDLQATKEMLDNHKNVTYQIQ